LGALNRSGGKELEEAEANGRGGAGKFPEKLKSPI
jgi:hypothetical protein